MIVNELLKTLMFAAQAHKAQKRKGNGGAPYVNHLIEVADLISNVAGICDTHILQAAILHDILEDTVVTKSQLKSEVGGDVVSLVESLTDNKELPLEARRTYQLKHISSACDAVKLIKLADHCSNIASIPPSWDKERIRSYQAWSYQIASQCFGVSNELAKVYMQRFEETKI